MWAQSLQRGVCLFYYSLCMKHYQDQIKKTIRAELKKMFRGPDLVRTYNQRLSLQWTIREKAKLRRKTSWEVWLCRD